MPRYWVPAFAGMTVDWFAVHVNTLMVSGYQPPLPVIPGAVKRRPGIHAEVMDSRFRGNDGGLVGRACEYADKERISAPAAPSFRAEWNGDPESIPRYWIPAFAGMTVDWLAVHVNTLIRSGYQPPLPRHSGRSETETRNPC